MKLWNGYMNNGDYGGWINETVVAETREEAIQILKEKHPYRVGIYDFGASPYKIYDLPEGYEVEIILRKVED